MGSPCVAVRFCTVLATFSTVRAYDRGGRKGGSTVGSLGTRKGCCFMHGRQTEEDTPAAEQSTCARAHKRTASVAAPPLGPAAGSGAAAGCAGSAVVDREGDIVAFSWLPTLEKPCTGSTFGDLNCVHFFYPAGTYLKSSACWYCYCTTDWCFWLTRCSGGICEQVKARETTTLNLLYCVVCGMDVSTMVYKNRRQKPAWALSRACEQSGKRGGHTPLSTASSSFRGQCARTNRAGFCPS